MIPRRGCDRGARPADRAFAPTCAASWCGRTRRAAAQTDSRSARSSMRCPEGSPPGRGRGGPPALRSRRFPDCDPAAGFAPGPCGATPQRNQARPRTAPEPLERMPGDPDRTVIALAWGKHDGRGDRPPLLAFHLDVLHLLRAVLAARLRAGIPARGRRAGPGRLDRDDEGLMAIRVLGQSAPPPGRRPGRQAARTRRSTGGRCRGSN